jgi:hypothetical protein
MSKVQIVTKALLAILGLSAVLNLCKNVTMATYARPDTPTAQMLLFFPVLIVLVVLTAYFLVLRNNWLACKICGGGDKLAPEVEAFWLTSCFRLAGICYGLILLCSSIPTLLNILMSPMHIRPLVNEILTFKALPKLLIVPATKWPQMAYNFFKAVLAVYLLCGWPQFVRRQLNLRQRADLAKTEA